MLIKATHIDDYLNQLENDRKLAFHKLYQVIKNNICPGFEEVMQYHMPGFAVPHSTYPSGYHCNPKNSLPFINIASQKHFIALYHCGIYADNQLLQWFKNEYPKHCKRKLDMGKSCIRFKYMDDIPYDLIGQLVSKITVADWIATYEKNTLK